MTTQLIKTIVKDYIENSVQSHISSISDSVECSFILNHIKSLHSTLTLFGDHFSTKIIFHIKYNKQVMTLFLQSMNEAELYINKLMESLLKSSVIIDLDFVHFIKSLLSKQKKNDYMTDTISELPTLVI